MNPVYILYFCLGILCIVTWELGKYTWRRFRKPYRWKCKICGFKIITDHPETYEISRSSHNHSRLREFRNNGEQGRRR